MEPKMIAKMIDGTDTLWQQGATRMAIGPMNGRSADELSTEPIPFGWIETSETTRTFVPDLNNILKTGFWEQIAEMWMEETLLEQQAPENTTDAPE
jgi:hypothetical protein